MTSYLIDAPRFDQRVELVKDWIIGDIAQYSENGLQDR